jgi:hypothetical protein
MESLLKWFETLILMMTGLIPAPAAVSNRPVFAAEMMKPDGGGHGVRLPGEITFTERMKHSIIETKVHRAFCAALPPGDRSLY